MTYEIKVSLHAHPHFFSPLPEGKSLTGKIALDCLKLHFESLFRAFPKVPSLKDIVEYHFQRRIGIGVISGCHAPTSEGNGMDNRFRIYMGSQLEKLDKDFDVDYNQKKGMLSLRRKIPIEYELSHLYLMNSQEVRAINNGNWADINIIGVDERIKHSQDIEETAKIGLDNGGIAIICHPAASACSAGIDKTLEMLSQRKAIAEYYNASISEKANQDIQYEMNRKGFSGVAVSDAHYLTQTDRAGIKVTRNLFDNFSRDRLRQDLDENVYENFYGSMTNEEIRNYHTLPIIASLPRQLILHPIRTLKKLLIPVIKSKFGKDK